MILGAWNTVGLYAIVFPTTGIPEWPSEVQAGLAQAAQPTIPLPPSPLPNARKPPPEVMAHIMNQPVEARQQYYMAWLQKQHQQQQLQQRVLQGQQPTMLPTVGATALGPITGLAPASMWPMQAPNDSQVPLQLAMMNTSGGHSGQRTGGPSREMLTQIMASQQGL